MRGPRLCLIEDDTIMGESLSDRFGLEGFGVDWYRSGTDALRGLAAKRYAAVVSDLRLPDISGDEVFRRASEQAPLAPPFVFITAYATVERAVELLKYGARDFVTKPFDISALVEKIRDITQTQSEVMPVAQETVLGISPAVRRLCENLPRIAKRASSVLATGESGVGKEVLARHLHDLACEEHSGPARPFVAVHGAALPESLIAAEFYGLERGPVARFGDLFPPADFRVLVDILHPLKHRLVFQVVEFLPAQIILPALHQSGAQLREELFQERKGYRLGTRGKA